MASQADQRSIDQAEWQSAYTVATLAVVLHYVIATLINF